MKTQTERDSALIGSVHQLLTLKHHSFLRVSLIAVLTAALGTWELLLEDDWLSTLMGFGLIPLALVLISEGGRFGLSFARLYSGWVSTAAILVGFTICFGIFRLFEYWSLLPLHRTASWSMLIWLGFVIGILLFYSVETDES